jgi:hypothetical protein
LRYYSEPDPCEGATRSFHAELLVEHRTWGHGAGNFIDRAKPIVTLHMVEEPARPHGRYIELDAQLAGRMYQRGGWILRPDSLIEILHGGRIMRDETHDVTLDLVAMRSERRRDPIRIDRAGQLWWGAQVADHARIADLGDAPADTPDDGAPLAMTLDGFPPAAHLEERVFIRAGGVGRSDSWYTLLALPDLEPLDACVVNKAGNDVVFECERGDHPRVVVAVDRDALVVTTAPAAGSSLERRFAIPEGACVDLEAGTGQESDALGVGTNGPMLPEGHDPFTWIVAALTDIPDDPTDRCALAPHDGPEVEIRIDGPPSTAAANAPTRDLVISAPAIAFREVEWKVTSCWGRVFPRTRAAFVGCAGGDLLVAVSHDRVWSSPFYSWPWSQGPALPCNARIRWRLSMNEPP